MYINSESTDREIRRREIKSNVFPYRRRAIALAMFVISKHQRLRQTRISVLSPAGGEGKAGDGAVGGGGGRGG